MGEEKSVNLDGKCASVSLRQKVYGQPPVLTSMMGLEAKTFSSMLASLAEPLTVAKYLMAYLADTVFPAPDSPLTMIDWFLSSLTEQNKTT